MFAQLLSAAVGIWLMAAPAVLGYFGAAATQDRVFGPAIATFALVAAWEVTRGLRYANLPIGGWLLLAPWILGYSDLATVNSSAAGLAVVLFSLARGGVKSRYGGGWGVLWRTSR